MLVNTLRDFERTMFVSDDRTFLRGPADRVLELAGEGHDRPLTFGGPHVEYVGVRRRGCTGSFGMRPRPSLPKASNSAIRGS
jgi:hypothetical protein